MAKSEIDAITAEFYGAFDNRGGRTADVERIRRLVLPGGVIVATGPKLTVYTVDEFVEPRRELLSDGRLTEFSEWETAERTDISGDIAVRFGEYGKSGILEGEPFEGRGSKSFNFVRTPDGWRIAAFSWWDHPA
ncbi:nuclear transport factor 2 family protein [Phytomonospora sp. NPDC050363]|uniref:nuclear transport factor 2 family protein n=1 Tax=Phytomonospora sp. NPDC050363 TaxID=3155642 RepID=UPI0033F46410